MIPEKEVAHRVESIGPRYLARLNDLVSIDCGTDNKIGVNAVGGVLKEMWSQWDWETEEKPQEKYGNIQIARIYGSGKGRIMLLGHMDTVYKDGVAKEKPMHNVQDTEKGNILMGPGVCDMKSCILNGMYAMKALQLAGFDDFEEIVLVCNGDEEVGSLESKFAYEQIARKMDAVLVLEAARPGGEIVSARKGVGFWNIEIQSESNYANPILAMAQKILAVDKLNGIRPGVTLNPGVVEGTAKTAKLTGNDIRTKRMKIEIQGIESHAGVAPEKGANAIIELARQLIRINALNSPADVQVSPIAIKGGTKRNTVPGRAAAVLEIQTTDQQMPAIENMLARLIEPLNPQTSLKATPYDDDGGYIKIEEESTNKASLSTDLRAFDDPSIEAVMDALESLVPPPFGFKMSSEGRFTNPHMPKTKAIEFLVELAKEVGKEVGIEIKDKSTGGGSDANIIAGWGIPVLDGLGPVGGDDHNADKEYIVLASIIPRIRLLAGLIQNICANREQLQLLRTTGQVFP